MKIEEFDARAIEEFVARGQRAQAAVDEILSQELIRAEGEIRVQKALEHIQRAQNELGSACAELSALVGGIPVWRATSKLYDRVRALWYRVEGFRARGRYRLDDTNVAALLGRETKP